MPTSVNQISVACACGKRLNAPASAAGKRARCPACKEVVVLPAAAVAIAEVDTWPASLNTPSPAKAAAVAVPQPVGIASDDDEDRLGALYDMADAEAHAPIPASNSVHCPQCQSAMEPHAVLCTNCGYDTRTGRSLSRASATAAAPAKKPLAYMSAKKAGKPVDYMAPTGSLVMGIIFSAVFALLASILWIVVAWATHLAIGYIAILIGIAAGVGMQAGHKGYSAVGGVIASLMTIIAIFTAKFVVLQILLASMGGRSISDIDSSKLAMYFFSPIGLIIICIGVGAAYRTANGSSRD